MNIHEYQAKKLLRKFNVPTSQGVVALSKKRIDEAINHLHADLYVVKAQVHAGGRGKAGGIKLAKDRNEAKKIAHEMWGMKLINHQTGDAGKKVQRIYIETGCKYVKEYYLSVVLDRAKACVTFVASSEGGTEIEEVASKYPDKIIKVSVNPSIGLQLFHCRKLAFGLGITGALQKKFIGVVQGIYKAFISLDASQIEINPLVTTSDNDVIALDAKMNFDDNGLFRHINILEMRDENEEDPLELRASQAELSYVKMHGNIGCMVNGAGLAMATMDIIKLYGGVPANFLDVGGTADAKRVTEAFKIILSDPNVRSILVNIFGGIIRCDIIAEGILSAVRDISFNVPLIVRLSGTNSVLGKEILNKSGLKIIVATDLADAASKAVETIK